MSQRPRVARRRTRPAIAAATAAGAMLAAVVATPLAASAAPVPVTTTPYRVAAISAPSVEFDLQASLVKADALTAAAAADGAELVAFGELWLPGYPKALNSNPGWGTTPEFQQYIDNSLVVGSAEWQQLLDVADDNDVFVSIGFSELKGDMLYMSQALIDPDGTALEVRHKVRPSGSERRYFSDTTMEDNLDVVQTSLGRIGMLECWEHLHAQMFFPMHAKGENVHIAAWPYLPLPGEPAASWEDSSVAESAARMYAIEGGQWVVTPAVGKAFIMNSGGTIVAQATAGQDFVTATINPRGFGGEDRYSATGENSWGVLQMIEGTYPESAKVPDTNHGTLNEVRHQIATDPEPTPEPTTPAPTTPPVDDPDDTPPSAPAPGPAADTDLTDDTRGGLALSPASGAPGTVVTGTLPSAAGTDVAVWLHSEPQLLSSTAVSAEGTFSVTIPQDAPAGEHRIVVLDDAGAVLGWAEFTVTAVAPATGWLASTGTTITEIGAAAALMVMAGTMLVLRRKQRFAAVPAV